MSSPQDSLELRYQAIASSLFECYQTLQSPELFLAITGEEKLPSSDADIHNFLSPGFDLLNRGGKRIRPLLLCLLVENLTDDEKIRALAYKLAPIVEIVHNGSLIIDDIEDDSDLRRGEPALHLQWGVDLALNAGNLMYFYPSYLLETLALPLATEQTIHRCYQAALRRLHFGQGFDIRWHNQKDHFPTIAQYQQMCRFKTGSLFRFSAELAAILTGRSDLLSDLGKIFENCGLAFQIMDDVINLTTGNVGKQCGDDLWEGKKSLAMLLYAQNNDTASLIDLLEKAHQHANISLATKEISSAIQLIKSSGSLDEAHKMGIKLLNNQCDQLKLLLPDNAIKYTILDLLNTITK